MPYERISVTPLSPVIGAEVSGVDLSQPLGNQLFQEIHDALIEHQVIFFRDQKIIFSVCDQNVVFLCIVRCFLCHDHFVVQLRSFRHEQPSNIPKIYAIEYHLISNMRKLNATGSKLLLNIIKK